MKLLVTGGLGFIGSNFIRYIFTKYDDIQITNIDKLSIGSNPANLKEIERDKRYNFIRGDITDKELVENLVNEADVIVNIAAETHVDRSIAEPWPFIHSNTIGAVTLFEATRKREKRILHISTDEIYGDILKGSFKENDKLKPSSHQQLRPIPISRKTHPKNHHQSLPQPPNPKLRQRHKHKRLDIRPRLLPSPRPTPQKRKNRGNIQHLSQQRTQKHRCSEAHPKNYRQT